MSATPEDSAIIADCQRWLEQAVIGLGLCPFAGSVHQRGQIAWQLTRASNIDALLDALDAALNTLLEAPASDIDTLLLIHPDVLQDFLDYNDFLDAADALLEHRDLLGDIQIASFHPHYQFAGEAPDDPANNSNRSPWPMLHLLREASLERVLQHYPDSDAIPQRNIAQLRLLGHAGWQALNVGPGCAAKAAAG